MRHAAPPTPLDVVRRFIDGFVWTWLGGVALLILIAVGPGAMFAWVITFGTLGFILASPFMLMDWWSERNQHR